MTKRIYLISIKALILLSPLPFGCVGKIFSPLFYLLLLVVSFIGLYQLKEKNDFLYDKWIKCFFYSFLVFLGFQVIPLPVFLLKILSPKTVDILSSLKEQLPVFHPVSLVPFETLVYGLQFLVFGLFFLVIVNIKLRKREMISLLNIAALSAVIQIIFAFLKYVQGNRYFFLFFLETESYQDRLTGTLGNSDHFAFYLEMILPLILSLFFVNLRFFERSRSLREKILSIVNERKRIIFYFIAAVLLGVGVILTGSRGGVSTMILSIIIFALFSAYLRFSANVQQKLKIIFTLILVAVLLIGVHNTVERFMKTQVEKEGRFKTRWPGTITMISDFPLFGTGFGTFRYSYYLYDNEGGISWTTHAHNDYLEVFSDGGIAGGILLLSLPGMIMVSIYKMWWKRRHPEVKMLGLGIIVSLFAVLFHSIFDFALRIPANAFIFVFVLALGVKIVNYRKVRS
ncbi:MAG: O-antigen ligase family protein [Candidatus Aminicenantes bacterium]|jgi:O-antigen ligase